MRTSSSALCLALCLAALAGACGASIVPRPTERDARWASLRWPDASVELLGEGRSLYVAKCSGCHALLSPDRVVTDAFPANLDEMAERARIDARQRELIARYLVTAVHAEGGDAASEVAAR